MRLNTLSFDGFRNLKKTALEFDPACGLFALVGPNGQGKTNLLEAIYLLGLSKSFRARKNEELIGFEADYVRLEGQAQTADETHKLEFIVTKTPAAKTLKVNGVIRRAADFVGTLKVVFFSPDDLSELAYAPAHRRRYLDVLLSQIDRDYLETSIQYGHVLKQRNALLKRIAAGEGNDEALGEWDAMLAAAGFKIMKKRASLLEALLPQIGDTYRNIAKTDDGAGVTYTPSFGEIQSADEFLEKLARGHARDVMLGSTNLGPHRDDLSFSLNGRDFLAYSSRGEWRSLVLALKFAEIDLITRVTGERPVLLLDDVFSELDADRQQFLMAAIKDTQTFITTTHAEFLKDLDSDGVVYNVREGKIG